MAVRGRRTKVLPSELNKVCPERGDNPAMHPRTMSDFEVVPNLHQSSSSGLKEQAEGTFPHRSNEKASSGGAGRRGGWSHSNDPTTKSENLISWIPENIQKKECTYFVESSQTSDSGRVVCECGYLREQHLEDAAKPPIFWGRNGTPAGTSRKCQQMPFGDIHFTGLGQKMGKYVRVSSDTPPRVIYHLMTQHWGLDAPNLLISVTGGAKNFHHEAKAEEHLPARSSQSGPDHWGLDHHGRVPRWCDEAASSAPWVAFQLSTYWMRRTKAACHAWTATNPHFILVDDGTHGRYGVEIPLRTSLEKFISEQTKVKGGVAIKIPIVCVVLEGGPGTLDTIYNAITNGTPCVIVEGSGRVADVIAQVASLPVPKITIALIRKKLSVFFHDTYELFTEGKLVEWTKKIQDIVRSRQLLTIFREGKYGQQDVDVAILQALFKASRNQDHFGHENWDHQLKLAVAWNRVDIARSEIFTDDHEWKPTDLHPVMAAALISNKPEFVKLFLEQGVRLKEFVTWDTLVYLYDQHGPILPDLGVALGLRGCLLSAASWQGNRSDHRTPCRFRGQVSGPSTNAQLAESPSPWTRSVTCLSGLWSRTARSWQKSSGPRARTAWQPALACSKILKELAKEEEDTDTTDEMLALAEQYEQKAIGVFTDCYRKDEERAQKLLTRVSEAWGKTTCLQLALEAKNMNFVSHGGVQAFLTKVWWGKMCVDNGLWRVIVCMLFFPLLYTSLITFREKRLQPMGCMTRLRAFFTAPVVIVLMNILSYFTFLLLFAYVLMVDFQPSPSWREYLIYFWLFSLVCEEIRQLLHDPDGFGVVKMASLYFKDFWNKLDICAILVFITGLSCRLIPSTLYPGRIILSLAFIIFCLRLMHIFTVSKTLGPKIIIVKRMMKDVFFFLFLLAVWVVSFGVAKQAILIHNEERVEWLFRGVVYHSYLTIFGQIPSYIDGVNFNIDQCSPNGTDPYKPKCPETNEDNKKPIFPEWLTVILLCLYLLFTNILLLNLLIAMFNYTFQQVQEHTDQIWKFQRHDLIEEYHGRPPAPPPFILLNHLQILVRRGLLRRPATCHKQLKKKLEKNEEAALLSWEMYLKENYLQHQQCQEKQNMQQKIRDIAQRVDVLVELLDLDRVKRTGLVEQKLASLEDQVHQSAQALRWIMQVLQDNGFGSGEDVPPVGSSKALEMKEADLEGKPEESQPPYHVLARSLLYPGSHTLRFPVPDEKVPWEVDFPLYDPPAYSADHKDMAVQDPFSPSLESLLKINYNTMDGLIDRQSFHGLYTVQDGLPLNPMGRTGLRGRGRLHCFGPNHALHPVVTRWRRNLDGSIIRKSLKKMLEVLVAQYPLSDVWALPGGSLEPGETLPLKLKWILRREFWPQFQTLLKQGTEIHKGYLDDPRNTDNAWVETVAVSVHFDNQNDVEMKRLNSFLQGCDPELCIRWQVLDKRIPLHANHKDLLHKVSTLLGAYY
ncbi:unnamed protein product [Bubo scandiacus]